MGTPQERFDNLFPGRPPGLAMPGIEQNEVQAEFDRLFPSATTENPEAFRERFFGLMGDIARHAGKMAQATGMAMQNPVMPNPVGAVMAAGVLSKGLLEPAEALIGFPTAFLGYKTNKAADFIRRARTGMYSKTEEAARSVGMTDEEIQASYDVGGFMGMTLPMMGAFKMATRAWNLSQATIKAWPLASSFVTDATAGAIYGGLFLSGGDLKDRGKHALLESAMWGAFRLVMTGTVAPFIAWRRKRAIEIDREGRLDAILKQIEEGKGGPIDPQDMPKVLELVTEENWVLQSPQALEMIERGTIDLATIAAIKELGEKKWGGAVFRNVGHTMEEVQAHIARMKDRYPTLKFSFPIKRDVKYTTLVEVGAEPPIYTLRKQPPTGFPEEHGWEVIDTRTGKTVAGLGTTVDSKTGEVFVVDVGDAKLVNKLGIREVKNLFRQAVKDLEAEGIQTTSIGGFRPRGRTQSISIKTLMREQPAKAGAPARVEVTESVYDVYFGRVGFSGKKLAQLKKEGMFEGQMLQQGSKWVQYVGKGTGKKLNHIKVRYEGPDGKWIHTHVKPESVTPTPWAREDWVPTPAMDAAYQDFFAWVMKKGGQVAKARGSVLEPSVIRAVGTGQAKLPEDGRRVFDQAGAIIHPEEAGLLGEEAITSITFQMIPGEMLSVGDGLHPVIAGITRSARETGPVAALSSKRLPARGSPEANLLAEMGPEAAEQVLAADVIAPKWRISYFQLMESGPKVINHQSYATLDDALFEAESIGLTIDKVTKKYPTGSEVAATIEQSGLEHATLLEPPPNTTFDDLVKYWAEERGLPSEAADYSSMVIYFKDRMRRWAWSTVSKEDRALFQQIWDEQERLLASGELPLEVLAAEKGFYAQRLPTGQIGLRHIETGLPMIFGGERTAREGLVKIITPEKDLPSIIPLGFDALRSMTGGLPIQTLLQFPDNVASLHTHEHEGWATIARVVRNIRDVFVTLERQTGIPFFTDGLDPLLKGREAFLSGYDPYAKAIHKAWKGIKKQRRHEIADVWIQAETNKLNFNDTKQLMFDSGFTPKEVAAFARSRAILDDLFRYTGIAPERYIETYYSRLRTFWESHGAMDIEAALSRFKDMKPSELEHWYEMTRGGELLAFEKDPEMMLHKYARGVMWKQHVKQPWDKMAVLTGTRGGGGPILIGDLPVERQQAIIAQASPNTTLNSPVVPKELREVIYEFLNAIRGVPGAAEETTRHFTNQFFKRLGIVTDARVTEEFVSVLMSTWYGAALAARPMPILRNMSQVIWNLFTRQGNRHIGRGLETALTEPGFLEAWEEGVLHISEAGIPMGDLIVQNLVERGAYGEGGPLSMAIASMIRKGLRAGTVSRDVARKLLVPYGSSDAISRGWAYWATKYHAEEWFTKFENGRIPYEKFEEEGLRFFDPVVKRNFRQVYDMEGRERALRYIGRIGSDEANFLYITGVQPGMLQKPLTRPFGMFGTYPIWQLELYFNRMANGTPKQIAGFLTRNAILAGAFANMSLVTGVSMWDWIAPGSAFGWAGGPAVQHLINLHRVLVAPMDQKSVAMKRMVEDGLRLSFPGQGAIRDLNRALAQDDPNLAFFTMMLGKPIDDTNWSIDYLYDPMMPPGETFIAPDTLQELREAPLWPMPEGGVLFEFGQPTPAQPRERAGTTMRIRAPAPTSTIEGTLP